jgi:hypothetical protein
MQKTKEERHREQNIEEGYDMEAVANALKIQRAWRRYREIKRLKSRVRKMKTKMQIANELLTSEQVYCDGLLVIIQEVLKPSLKLIEDQ